MDMEEYLAAIGEDPNRIPGYSTVSLILVLTLGVVFSLQYRKKHILG